MHKIKRGYKREKRLNKNFCIILILSLIFLSVLIILFFYLENRIYQENYVKSPGDCGQFVIWQTAWAYNISYFDDYLQKISLETNPFKLFTGPLTIRKSLKKIGIETKFYTNFSIKQIKRKLDENKPVIVMMNINNSHIFAGATHYLFVYDYKEINDSLQGFYFTDTYYFGWNWSEPVYFNISEFETKRQNIMNNKQILGRVENLIGLEKFVIVVGEEGEENLNLAVRLVFYIQDFFARFLISIGKIVIIISNKV